MQSNREIMQRVLKLAEKSYEMNEVPVACIITKNGKVISEKFNQKEKEQISTSHAEILCINEACQKLGKWRLNGCKLYVNLEPCLMCLGAIIESRIDELIFAAYDYKMGGINGRYGISVDKVKLTHITLNTGLLINQSKTMLKNFFEEKR